jgi:hypothetical protein
MILGKALFAFCFAGHLSIQVFSSQAKTFYVSAAGDDRNSGLSPASAWQTLNRVNEIALKPAIASSCAAGTVSKAGSILTRTMLAPKQRRSLSRLMATAGPRCFPVPGSEFTPTTRPECAFQK